jgi:hypothetical protein
MADRYERVYDVGLLDDLHNYFPGLLYEPDRFRTVSDVLGYVRQNASRRFNLFDYGARQYQQQQNTRVPQNTFTRQTPVVNRWTPPAPVAPPSRYEFDLTSEVDLAILAPLLRSLDTLSGLAPPAVTRQTIQRANGANRFAGIFQDIIVHASQELIDNGSNIRTLLMDLEESCSICQDRMRQGENIRRLNACQHEFHGACVDNWFLQRSVLCPVCRHDIRDPTPVLRSPLLTATTNPPAVPTVSLEEETEDENEVPETPTSRLRTRTDINSMFNRRLE